MSEPKRLNGFWWLPSAPQQKWFGTLTHDGRNIELCCFAEQEVPDPGSMPQTFTLHGSDEKENAVTLLFADYAIVKQSCSLRTIRFRAKYALIGAHLGSKDDIKATQIVLEINYLHEWLGLTGFRPNLSGKIGKDRFEVTIPYVRPDQFGVTLQDGTSIGFCLNTNYTASIKEQRIAEDSFTSICRKNGFSFEQIWQATTQLRLLLHFAILKPVYAESMTLQFDAETKDGKTKNIEVLSINLHGDKPAPLYGRQFAFRFKDIAPTFADFYDRWIEFASKYDEALGCYMTTVFHNLPSTVALLCLTQAIEAFHGVHHTSHDSHNFRDKVKEIICSNTAFISGLIEDDADFSDRVLVTRNYYTHHNPKWLKEGKVASGRDLIRMNEKLKLLFQSCVLQYLGLPPEAGAALKQQIASDIIEY